MAVNLSAISNATTTATALANLILVTPNQNQGYQPQNAPILPGKSQSGNNPSAILFHYEGEQTVTLQSDITDHYVEDNTSVQDQIALRPEMITTSGFIGELNDVVPPLLAPLKFIADKLTVIDAYTPALSTTALIAFNEATLAYELASTALHSAVSAWNFVTGGSGAQTKQQQAYSQFKAYWQNRQLFTIQTPWEILENMAIFTLRAIQDSETNMITNFEITFKKIRFASTITTGSQALQFQGRAQYQAAGLLNNGVSTPPASLGLNTQLSSSFPNSFGGA